jgi:hypothetical protein
MKYTARHVRRFLEQGKIDPALWMKHFPSVLDTRVPACRDCEDHKNKTCEGGKNPVDCFLSLKPKPEPDQMTETPVSDNKRIKKPKQYRWTARDRGKITAHGANKTYDQSRI